MRIQFCGANRTVTGKHVARLRREGMRPRRTIRMALTCGEETSNRVNGVDYLLQNKRELIDAALATHRRIYQIHAGN